MKIAPMKVDLIDHMGSDLTVVNAARVSFAKESQLVYDESLNQDIVNDEDLRRYHASAHLSEADAKLINYLAKHNHWTPFGHCFIQFRIKAPIFVARQLVKHQVGLVWNEVSRRYVDEEPEFWFPTEWRGRPEGSMKQGSSGVVSHDWAHAIAAPACDAARRAYQLLLDGGAAPEQARMILPQNMMTEWYWSGSLAAFARICKLRLDPHAQAETREIAAAIYPHAEALFPVAWKALMEN